MPLELDIFSRPGHLITRCSRLFVRWGEARFQALGLGLAQMPVLYALKSGNALTQKDLAHMARIEQPTMAQLLTRMERDHLITRSPDPTDRRSSLIALTPAAIARIPAARDILAEGNDVALKGFTDREILTLSRLLKRVVDNMIEATDPANPAP